MNTPQLGTFPGGIKPPANKVQSNATPIQNAGIPDVLIFPLAQRQSDAIPIIGIGQNVLKGELIARAGDIFGAPIHAATSGEIIAIEERPVALPNAAIARCIVLRTDGRDEWTAREPISTLNRHSPLELIERIRNAGVIGAGGAGFPAARKLLDDNGAIAKPETLILNGAECEPYITADDRLMRERADDIVRGIDALKQIVHPQRIVIGIEEEQREALAAMRRACASTNIEVIAVPTLYPMGGEGQLIQVLTGRAVPVDGIPADIGVLCFNVGTVYAIYRAIYLGEPMLSRIVTIAGRACATNANYEVLVGTPLQHVLNLAGYQELQCARLIVGGPLMGFAIDHVGVPITKTSHCFIAGSADEFPAQPVAQACIRCGFCAEVCPVTLLPQQLHAQARQRHYDRLADLHLSACIECGACDYVCPSHIPLAQTFRQAKREIQIIDYEQRQAQQAKARFAAHQQRSACDKRERELQREQRLKNAAAAQAESAASATPADSKKATIEAAIARAKAKKAGAPQRPAVAAALTQTEPPAIRLRQRIAEIELLMRDASAERRARLQRSLDDLQSHLAEAEARPDADSVRNLIERALHDARNLNGDEPS